MIDVKEHFYQDDPGAGHPDVKTCLKGGFYFFLGNGLIQGAVQVSPMGEGTALGLIVMDPEILGPKRSSLTMDPERGLEDTEVSILLQGRTFKAGREVDAAWTEHSGQPAVEAFWQAGGFTVTESTFCPFPEKPVLRRKINVRHDDGAIWR